MFISFNLFIFTNYTNLVFPFSSRKILDRAFPQNYVFFFCDFVHNMRNSFYNYIIFINNFYFNCSFRIKITSFDLL